MSNSAQTAIRVRLATPRDLPDIMRIFNREILESVNSFRTQPLGESEAQKWWKARHEGKYPAWVAEREHHVAGWASLSQWSAYEGYAGTAEVSIWTDVTARRQGIAKRLFEVLIREASQLGFRVLLSRIEASNEASIALHRNFGFVDVGTMHNVGEKFGRLLDVLVMEKQLC